LRKRSNAASRFSTITSPRFDANAQFNAAVRPDTGVPLGHRLLYSDRAAHRIDDAGKFDQQAVAGGLDDAAPVLGDFWIDQFTPQRCEAFERAFLVRPHQPRITRDIGGEDCGETPGLTHAASPAANRRPDSKSSRSSGVAPRQIPRHDLRGNGAQPHDDRPRFVEPPLAHGRPARSWRRSPRRIGPAPGLRWRGCPGRSPLPGAPAERDRRPCAGTSPAPPQADGLKGADFARRALEVAGDDPGILTNACYALAYFGGTSAPCWR